MNDRQPQSDNAFFETVPEHNRPGEAAKRRKMRALYGRNREVNWKYPPELAAVCENGVFLGKDSGGVLAFKGIPYAKPPVGDRRWQPSVLPDPCDKVFEAYHYGKSPIQTQWPSEEGSYYPQSEDCLTLNVWTAGKDRANKPVMVFFHGGSYGWGATSDPIYEGHNLVSRFRDIVLVTVEYRLGIMGFIDFSRVPGGEDYPESGNLGLLDHVTALQWVRKNIAAFGGDPENVTVFGESAGGGTVSLLPVMPQAKGLFRRVIAESGSVALTYSREECYRLVQRLMKATDAENMDELRMLSEEELREVNEELNDYNNFPERDGVVLPEDLYAAYESGVTAHVDMMSGTNADEVRYWIREMGYYTNSWMGRAIFKLGLPVMFDSNIERVCPEDRKYADAFLHLVSGRKWKRMLEFFNDILFRVPAAYQAEKHAENGGRAYLYFWKYPSAHRGLGACHAVELAYVFNNTDVTIYTGNNIHPGLASQVQEMWVNFARTGDPSTPEHRWEPYTAADRTTAILDKKISFRSDPLGERRQAAEPLLRYYFNGCYTNLNFKVPFFYQVAAVLALILGAVPAGLIFLGNFLVRKGRKALGIDS